MNDLIVNNSKKVKRRKKRKQKAKLTSSYKKNEQEVQNLLDEQLLQELESDTQSTEFFCKATTFKSLQQYAKNVTQLEDDLESIGQEQEVEEEEYEGTTRLKTPSDETSMPSEKCTVESTYIQIDALDENVTTNITKQKQLSNMESLLYKPASVLNAYITIPMELQVNMNATMVRMLNRYYQETEVTTQLAMSLQSSKLLQQQTELYHTICVKQFTPIFCPAQAELVQIPTRRLLILHFKQLHLTEHPELLIEHRLANGCEKAFVKYMTHKNEQICEHLKLKLRQERAVMQQLLQQASEEYAQEAQLAKQIVIVQNLRQELCDSEKFRKELLQTVLDNWLLLKKLRKSQMQQYTRFKLRLNIKTPSTSAWKQRYKQDLQEIYSEKLEQYYRQRRNWKQQKKQQTKPRKPQLKEISNELRKQYKALYGEPIIEIQRCDLNVGELGISKTKLLSIYMRIFLDNKFVGNTRAFRLEPDFTCHINETFGILLERFMPKEVSIGQSQA